MTTLLEERYRRALRVLPAAYRAAWEEDMVATFLARAQAAHPDDPDAVDVGVVGWPERWSVLRLAVRLRLGGRGAPPRDLAWGEAVRTVTLVGLLLNAAHALVRFGNDLVPSTDGVGVLRWELAYSIVALAWVPAFVFALWGRQHAARWCGVVAFMTVIVYLMVGPLDPFPASLAVSLAWQLAPLLGLAAFHADAPPVRRAPWWIGLGAATAALTALTAVQSTVPDRGPVVDEDGLWCIAVVIAAAVVLGRPRLRNTPATALTGALLGLAALVPRLITVATYRSFPLDWPGRTALLTTVSIEALVTAAATTLLTFYAVRGLRRLSTQRPQ